MVVPVVCQWCVSGVPVVCQWCARGVPVVVWYKSVEWFQRSTTAVVSIYSQCVAHFIPYINSSTWNCALCVITCHITVLFWQWRVVVQVVLSICMCSQEIGINCTIYRWHQNTMMSLFQDNSETTATVGWLAVMAGHCVIATESWNYHSAHMTAAVHHVHYHSHSSWGTELSIYHTEVAHQPAYRLSTIPQHPDLKYPPRIAKFQISLPTSDNDSYGLLLLWFEHASFFLLSCLISWKIPFIVFSFCS